VAHTAGSDHAPIQHLADEKSAVCGNQHNPGPTFWVEKEWHGRFFGPSSRNPNPQLPNLNGEMMKIMFFFDFPTFFRYQP